MAAGQSSKRKADATDAAAKIKKKKRAQDDFVFTTTPLLASQQTPRGTTKLHPLLHDPQSPAQQVPLATAETPMIARNQDMRAGGDRRTSLERRGRRASSIGGGFEATPHPSLPDATLFRHLDAAEPPAVRLLTLLNWSARRQQERSPAAATPIQKMANAAIAAFIADLSTKQLDVALPPPVPSTSKVTLQKQPNPENEALKRKMAGLDEWTASLAQEDAARRAHMRKYALHRDSAARSATQAASLAPTLYNLSLTPLAPDRLQTPADLLQLGKTIKDSAVSTAASRRKSEVAQLANPDEIDVEAELGICFAELRSQASKAQMAAHRLTQLVETADAYSSHRMSAVQDVLASSRKPARTATPPGGPSVRFLAAPSSGAVEPSTADLLRTIARDDVANRRR